ncbi:MAG TPA: phage tail assembly chaperone [Caulobacteraceae bacterium]|nr:phage tail assembly chaperone [Caulobacteraceae bacterium]
MTPWPRLLWLAAGMGVMPEAFWRLSLVEWRALSGGDGDALTRTGFEALSRRFPDKDA